MHGKKKPYGDPYGADRHTENVCDKVPSFILRQDGYELSVCSWSCRTQNDAEIHFVSAGSIYFYQIMRINL